MNFENHQPFDLKENTKYFAYQQACQPVRQDVLEFCVSFLISKYCQFSLHTIAQFRLNLQPF